MNSIPRTLIPLLIVLVCYAVPLHAQTYNWVRGGGTNQSLSPYNFKEETKAMCTDFNGNVYALSVVGNNAIIADTFYRSGAFGSPENMLLTSHDCNRQMRFAKLISANEVSPHGVTCDELGHVYIAFYTFHGNTFGSYLRIGSDTTITGSLYNRQTLVQFDTTGHLNWVRFVGANLSSTSYGTLSRGSFVAMDNADNVHFINSMKYGVEITPSITSHWGTYDLMYDVTGNLLSVKKLDIDSSLQVDGATIDKQSGKLYAYGVRSGMFLPDSSRYAYIAGMDLDHYRIWIDTLSNPVVPNSNNFNAIIADGLGHIYTTIGAPGAVAYRDDTARNVLSTTPYMISVVMKMDTSGYPLWMRTFSASLSVNGMGGLTLAGRNKIAAIGGMTGAVVCGADTINSYSGEGQNAYFTIIDTAGYVQTLQQLHGVGFYDWGRVGASDSVGNLYIGGKVENNIWAGGLTPYTSVGGDTDYFIMKYGVDCSCTSMPVANYTYTGTDLVRSFTYTGTSTGIDSVRWTFGDGGTSNSMAPVHTYTGAGTFTTCVRVYTACGSDMRCYEVVVACAALPVSSFSDTGSLVHGFTFSGTTAGLDSVAWDFGDGSTGAGTDMIHTYAVTGTYHVCATVYTNCGTHTHCVDIIIPAAGAVSSVSFTNENIRVYPNPATNELYVSGVSGSVNYRLINVVGVAMQEGALNAGTNHLQLGQLPVGIYVLEIVGRDGSRRVVRVEKW